VVMTYMHRGLCALAPPASRALREHGPPQLRRRPPGRQLVRLHP
jgi:hypothetical protein